MQAGRMMQGKGETEKNMQTDENQGGAAVLLLCRRPSPMEWSKSCTSLPPPPALPHKAGHSRRRLGQKCR